jgi:hypothetical protein
MTAMSWRFLVGLLGGFFIGMIGWAIASELNLSPAKRVGTFVVFFSAGYISLGLLMEQI